MAGKHFDIAVLTVIPEELKWALRGLGILDSDETRAKVHQTYYWSGKVRSRLAARDLDVVLTCIGQPGNYDASAATMEILIEYRPKLAFLTGIAAGLRDKVKIGEVVVSERVWGYEPGVEVQKGNEETFIPRPDSDRIDHRLLQDIARYQALLDTDRIEATFRALNGVYPSAPEKQIQEFRLHVAEKAGIRVATIASGEKLLKNPKVLYALHREQHGRIEAGEMEATGFVTACRRRETPWLIFRGISDFGDEFKNDVFQGFAAAMATIFMRDFIEHGLGLQAQRPLEGHSPFPSGYVRLEDALSRGQLGQELEQFRREMLAEIAALWGSMKPMPKQSALAVRGDLHAESRPIAQRVYRVLDPKCNDLKHTSTLSRWYPGVMFSLSVSDSVLSVRRSVSPELLPLSYKPALAEFDIRLSKVLDLNDSSVLLALSSSRDELLAKDFDHAQRIAAYLHDAGWEGMLVPQRHSEDPALVVFDRIQTGSRVEIVTMRRIGLA